ncbi:MAG TPA: CDP-diacylglycerol--serine O-phosphatidyltransferase [candidate division Zixibacteria bacterium]|nr:CDP-diacylglycerol--serine O-phosphatidyltransferase [candidate division Zixibacteria bacterium]
MNTPGGEPIPTGKVRLLQRRPRPRVPLKQRMPAEKLKRGVYLIPNLFTAGNLICGFFSILATFKGEYLQATLYMIAAHLLDGVDGLAARMTKTSSQFGIEFDSLADLVSFGVAPAVLFYFWALVPWGALGWFGACLYVVCGALRLSRFNVQARGVEKSHFVGLPIPAAAEMVGATVVMYYFLGGEGAPGKAPILLVTIYVLAALMVSNLHFFSLKQAHLQKRFPIWMLVSGVFLIILFFELPQVMYFTTFLLYMLSGPLLWCWTAFRRRREKRGETAGAMP